MYIDNFLWLPDIIEKLAAKHHVTEEEVEDVFFNQPIIVLLSLDIEPEKMFTLLWDKLMQVDI